MKHCLARQLLLGNTLSQQSPTFLAPGASFMEGNLSMDWGQGGNGLGMIQVHYIYCVLYF